jgi:hypothetical protein
MFGLAPLFQTPNPPLRLSFRGYVDNKRTFWKLKKDGIIANNIGRDMGEW